MADLSYIQSTLEVKIAGQNSTGSNVNYVSADPNGNMLTKDALGNGIQFRAQSVTTSAAEALGGATILANRRLLSITPTNGTIYWGGSGVTTTSGSPVFANNTLFLDVTDNVHIFVIAAATTDVRVAELS